MKKLPKSLVKYATTVTPFSKFLAALIFLITPLFAFWVGTKYQRIIDNHELNIAQYIWKNTQKEPPVANIYGAYSGVLPCSDCDGVETKLSLFTNAQSSPSSFTLEENYLGQNEKKYNYTGTWKLQIGGKRDKTAEIYILNIEGEDAPRSYLKIDDNQIQVLDKNQNIINSKENLNLIKI